MTKTTLFTLLVSPALLFASPNFECTAAGELEGTQVTIQLNSPVKVTPGTQFVRAQVSIQGPEASEKACVPFHITTQFARAGFVRTYQSQVSKETSLWLTERAFQTSGPVEFQAGSLRLHAGTEEEVTAPLKCITP